MNTQVETKVLTDIMDMQTKRIAELEDEFKSVWNSLDKTAEQKTALKVELKAARANITSLLDGNQSLLQELVPVRECIVELERQIRGYQSECRDAEQELGKALGYPWYKDDQKNFPDATEAEGVCVGDHTTASIAAEARKCIAELKADVKRLTEVYADARKTIYDNNQKHIAFELKLQDELRAAEAITDLTQAMNDSLYVELKAAKSALAFVKDDQLGECHKQLKVAREETEGYKDDVDDLHSEAIGLKAELKAARIEIGRLTDERDSLKLPTCGLCNLMERADCVRERDEAREQLAHARDRIAELEPTSKYADD